MRVAASIAGSTPEGSASMQLSRERVRQLGGAAGIAFVIIALIALFLPGAPPKADDALSKVSEYFVDKRGAILASNYLLGVAFSLFLVFVGCLRSHLGAGGGVG